MVQAQSDTMHKVHRHELGADITSLIKQFLNFNNSFSIYTPVYYVSYRYHFKNNKYNFRFGVGRNFNSTETKPFFIDGKEQTYRNNNSQISLRMGFEKTYDISSKWQVYYGADIRPTYTKIVNKATGTLGGYIQGNRSSGQILSLSPLLGFRYNLSKGVSITTETSFSWTMDKSFTQKTFISSDSQVFPEKQADRKFWATNYSSGFTQPLFLIFSIDL